MTFNPKADISGSSAKRRGGRNTAVIGGGAVGIGAIVVVLFSLLTGTDLTGLLGGAQPGTDPQPAASARVCKTGQDANEDDACRIEGGQWALDSYWGSEIDGYRAPSLTIVSGSTNTRCGVASNQVGPFYCPPEEGIYIDPTFYGLLRSQFGATAGELAQLYILAHEWGHHIQNITGIMDQHPNNGTGPSSNGVRMELQADCFAGAFIGRMTEQKDSNGEPYLEKPTEKQIVDALDAAKTVGDDHIQEQSGRVNPETWTHGSSEQRQRWFATGYQRGVAACDVFQVGAKNL